MCAKVINDFDAEMKREDRGVEGCVSNVQLVADASIFIRVAADEELQTLSRAAKASSVGLRRLRHTRVVEKAIELNDGLRGTGAGCDRA